MVFNNCYYCKRQFIITDKEKCFCSQNCRDKRDISRKNHLERNREKILLKGRENYQKDKEHRRAQAAIHRKKNPNYMKEWRIKNKDHVKKYDEEHKEEKREYGKRHGKKYYAIPEKRAHRKEYMTNYMKTYSTDREKHDIPFKMQRRMQHRVWGACKAQNAKKNYTFKEYLGCNVAYFMAYNEALFSNEMSWDNYGQGLDKWNFDHIRPCTSFDWNVPEQQLLCSHFLNQQPLWQKDNYSKNNRYNDEDKARWERTEKEINRLRNLNTTDREKELNKILEYVKTGRRWIE